MTLPYGPRYQDRNQQAKKSTRYQNFVFIDRLFLVDRHRTRKGPGPKKHGTMVYGVHKVRYLCRSDTVVAGLAKISSDFLDVPTILYYSYVEQTKISSRTPQKKDSIIPINQSTINNQPKSTPQKNNCNIASAKNQTANLEGRSKTTVDPSPIISTSRRN
jgi:hypothetical protein